MAVLFLWSVNNAVDGLAQGFEGVFIGGVEQALFVEDDVAAGGFEFFFDEADALAAPAVGAEGEGFVAFGGQALEVAEEGGDGRHHLVVDGRGADGEVFAREDVGQDVGEGVFLDVVEGRGDALLLEASVIVRAICSVECHMVSKTTTARFSRTPVDHFS